MSEPLLDVLARRAQSGDRAALEELLRGLEEPMSRLARRFLGDRERARDATQEILILLITKLSTFRGESRVTTWAHTVATRHLLGLRGSERRRRRFEEIGEHLGQPANAIEASTLEAADARLVEEEVFLGCTQAMLDALDRDERIAFILGAICELPSPDAAAALGIGEAAFRKRLSRARETLDSFLARNCGVADPRNPCRCAHQVNFRVARGALDPRCLRFAAPIDRTSLERLRAARVEVGRVRRSLELYAARQEPRADEEFVRTLRTILDGGGMRIFDA